MEKELSAALIGGVVGVVGSLLSVAMGYLLQSKVSRRQFEEERALHKEQLENERAIHLEQIASQRAFINENIKRENNLRLIDMLTRDVRTLEGRLQSPDFPHHEKQEIARQLTAFNRKREQLLKAVGIDLVRV
jgi:hypothetical protein